MNDTWMERAKTRMRAQGISQEDLADRLTCTRGAVGHYLSGRRNPSLKQFELIARTLNTDLVWLLYGDNPSYFIKDKSADYQLLDFRAPITGKLSSGLKRRPVAFLSVPTPDRNCYALLIDTDDYSPRIFAGEAILVSPGEEPLPGDEMIIQYRNGQLKLHTFINRKKGQLTIDSIVGKKNIQNIKSKDIKFMHKIIAVFRANNIID